MRQRQRLFAQEGITMVNNLDIYLLEHRERLRQCSQNPACRQVKRRFSLHLPGWKQIRALLFL
jgi:hypothetical protein